MNLAAKLALGSCVVAVGVCGVLAYIAADDERRDFVKGSTCAAPLPDVLVMAEAEAVDDEYEDTDDESDAEIRLMQVQPTPTPGVWMENCAKATAKARPLEPQTSDEGSEVPYRVQQRGKLTAARNNNATEMYA